MLHVMTRLSDRETSGRTGPGSVKGTEAGQGSELTVG